MFLGCMKSLSPGRAPVALFDSVCVSEKWRRPSLGGDCDFPDSHCVIHPGGQMNLNSEAKTQDTVRQEDEAPSDLCHIEEMF